MAAIQGPHHARFGGFSSRRRGDDPFSLPALSLRRRTGFSGAADWRESRGANPVERPLTVQALVPS